ncbi:MAG TPA: hypothetical protein VET26_10520 [Candidatus Sulfotelmatobacter sp.]|nr:hypothetical protein [Candidatus Sulfotelmatobacter sp.]
MKTARSTDDQVDARYHALFRIGGIAFILTGVAYFTCLAITYMIPASSSDAAAYLRSTGGKVGVVTALWVVYMVSDLLLVPGLLALYMVLKERSRALLLIGTALVAGYLVFDLGMTEPNWLALAGLAHGYASTTGAAQPSYVAAAQYGLALVPVLNFLSFAVSGAGFLLISIVMLRSTFRRRTAVFGIAVMSLSLVASTSWFVPFLGSTVFAVLGAFGLWCVVVGGQMYRLGSRIGNRAAAEARFATGVTPRAAGVA